MIVSNHHKVHKDQATKKNKLICQISTLFSPDTISFHIFTNITTNYPTYQSV